MNSKATAWLLLITNLAGQNQTLRMRIWRALKAAGAGLLRDGVYVLPQSSSSQETFDKLAREIRASAGTVHIVSFHSDSVAQQNALLALFDRTAEYQTLNARLEACKRQIPKAAELEARRSLAAIARNLVATVATDFFPGKRQDQVQSALADVEGALNARFSPNEPRAAHRKIPSIDAKKYQNRTWATRERLWIDRVASAWLIRRFIDRRAKFLWLKNIKDCPKQAVGFDFDDAEFSHVDSRVTFEVLLASFGLEQDAGLVRLGALVHHLDVGGIPTAEGPGFATIMAGARSLQPDDDALLKAMMPVLESLYAAYSAPES